MAHRDPVYRPGTSQRRALWSRRRWLAVAILVAVAAVRLLSLRSMGLGLLGTKGTLAIFVLGEGLGVVAVVFVGLALLEASRGQAAAAAEDLSLGRRWALAGLVFVCGMLLIAAAAKLIPSVMTS